jgi:hypothetical protein
MEVTQKDTVVCIFLFQQVLQFLSLFLAYDSLHSSITV